MPAVAATTRRCSTACASSRGDSRGIRHSPPTSRTFPVHSPPPRVPVTLGVGRLSIRPQERRVGRDDIPPDARPAADRPRDRQEPDAHRDIHCGTPATERQEDIHGPITTTTRDRQDFHHRVSGPGGFDGLAAPRKNRGGTTSPFDRHARAVPVTCHRGVGPPVPHLPVRILLSLSFQFMNRIRKGGASARMHELPGHSIAPSFGYDRGFGERPARDGGPP
jgi:hypothetical protein